MNAATADTCSPPPSRSGQTTKPRDQSTDKMIPEKAILLTPEIQSIAPESLILPPDGLFSLPSKRKAQIESSLYFSALHFTFQESGSHKCQLHLAKSPYFVVFAHFFRHGVPPNAPRRVPQHDASFCPTRRELISARPRPFGKIDAKRALFRPFPECAIIDIMKAKDA